MAHNPRTTDNPKHKTEQEQTHKPHEHPPGIYHSHVPHVHTVKYKKKDGTTKVYKYPYEIINNKLANR